MLNQQFFGSLLVFVAVVACVFSAVIDLRNSDQHIGRQAAQHREDNVGAGSEDLQPTRSCLCDGMSCICCADFNLTFIDIGGPGCVRVKYLSPEEGMAVNITYGDNMLSSDVVKGPRPEPTCANFIGGVAGLCARFAELTPLETGLRACLNLEPQLLGSPQLAIPIGCFSVGPNGMEALDDPTPAHTSADGGEPDKLVGMSTAQLIQVVNDSAEEGIALISNLFGVQFGQQQKPPNAALVDSSHEIVNNAA